ncbi:toll-like receptor 3 isoform X2 [Struthio camelus]|uniref:toll-like receptor 3 isoform X2 n=1 Tax=Struthio camelus TaxID=8801 RepID=UPI003603BA00
MRSAVFCWSSLSFRLVSACLLCASAGKPCEIRNKMADCSHLKLNQIPSDLPNNIMGLDISHNQIKMLSPANLTRYNQLVYLNAGYNSISKLQPELCQNVPLLQILKLEHNQLHELSDRVFASCTNLTDLDLGYNIIQIKNDPFKTLKNLITLDLSHNNLKSANLGSEEQLKSLHELVLSNNNISELKKEDFSFLRSTSLNRLDLSSNPLKEFHLGCLRAIGNLYGLILNNVELGENHTKKLCTELSNTAIQNLSLSHVKLSYVGWRITFYWNISVNRVLGFKEIDRRQEEFDYDAYIIHARRDKDWVSENFIPLEENNQFQIRFCLEERDFEAGISEFEATINSIKRSRKIIFVVTEHLLKDPWCKKFKVYHAVQQAIEQSRDSIVLIFLHDIPDYKLNHALCLRRGMFRSRCILNWPAQKERVNAFHQQLMMALKSNSKVH